MLNRRAFLQASAAAAAGSWSWGAGWNEGWCEEPPRPKLPVAGITTVYGKNNHADVIYGKITDGWKQDGGPGPALRLASLYIHQPNPNDLGHTQAKKHDIRLCDTVDEALTFGGNDLAVSGVILVGEHGNYGLTEDTQQKMYPRRELFDAITATFRRVGRSVPVFNDKHLSYNWPNAKHMVDTARELKFPMLAGSSIPVAWRVPEITLSRNCPMEQAMMVGYGGLESYGFHTLEGMQQFVERRRGGETGVARVETVTGDRIWETGREGRWSRELFDAALNVAPRVKEGDPETLLTPKAAWYLIEYRDGFRTAAAMAIGLTNKNAFAARLAGVEKPVATHLALQEGPPYSHFAYLLRAIEELIHTGKSPYPVERTLLTTGILNAAMLSMAQKKPIETPYLDVRYEPADWPHAPGTPPPVEPPTAPKNKG